MAYNRDIYEKAQKIIDGRREDSEKKAEARARLSFRPAGSSRNHRSV